MLIVSEEFAVLRFHRTTFGSADGKQYGCSWFQFRDKVIWQWFYPLA